MDIARQRLQQQRLTGAPLGQPEDVVQWLVAVQAQDYGGAKWGIAQRVKRGTDAAVEQAYVAGRILRTHVMRPTWHFVAPADIRWLLELTAPRVHAANAYYYRQCELDAAVFERSQVAMARALAGGKQLTREQLARVLAEARIPASGLRLVYLIMHAELDALICSGGLHGKQHTYALLDERAPRGRILLRDEALAVFARRYVSGHGPALVQDFAGWSGLTVTEARHAFELNRDHLEHDVVNGKTYWHAPAGTLRRKSGPTVHLLPNYDELFSAFKDRDATLDEAARRQATPLERVLGGHIVVRNGRAIGGWRRTLGKTEVAIEARLLVPLAPAERQALEQAAQRYAESLGVAAAKLSVRSRRAGSDDEDDKFDPK